MKKRIIILMVSIVLFTASCSNSNQRSTSNTIEEEKITIYFNKESVNRDLEQYRKNISQNDYFILVDFINYTNHQELQGVSYDDILIRAQKVYKLRQNVNAEIISKLDYGILGGVHTMTKFTNNLDHNIRAFKGSIYILNSFNDVINKIDIVSEEGIPAKSSITLDIEQDWLNIDEQYIKTKLSKFTYTWMPAQVKYE